MIIAQYTHSEFFISVQRFTYPEYPDEFQTSGGREESIKIRSASGVIQNTQKLYCNYALESIVL